MDIHNKMLSERNLALYLEAVINANLNGNNEIKLSEKSQAF